MILIGTQQTSAGGRVRMCQPDIREFTRLEAVFRALNHSHTNTDSHYNVQIGDDATMRCLSRSETLAAWYCTCTCAGGWKGAYSHRRREVSRSHAWRGWRTLLA